MSKILWSIGQIVEDPSNTIISSLKKHIFNSESDVVTDTDAGNMHNVVAKTISKIQRMVPSASLSPVASCSKNKNLETHKSKSVQIGTELVQRRNFSVQCSKFPVAKISKTTSVPIRYHTDHSTATQDIEKKHAFTEPLHLHDNICEEHKHAINLLRKWPTVEKTLEAETLPVGRITFIKTYLTEKLKILKLEKILSVPQYQSIDMEFMKLYKKASVEETRNLIPQTKYKRLKK